MSDVTRRELFGLAAAGALGMAASGYVDAASEVNGTEPNGVAAAGAPPVLAAGAKPHLKIAVQGLTVIHRDYDQQKNVVGLRLATINTKENGGLMLAEHVPIFGVPQRLLESWDAPPSFATMDYVFWTMSTWEAHMEVETSDRQKWNVGGPTKLGQKKAKVDPHDCAQDPGKWKNAHMIVNFKDLGFLSKNGVKLKADWQHSHFISSFLELPYGVVEDDKVYDGPHELFDGRIWMFAGGASAGQKRALKNVVRIGLSDVEAATVTVPSRGKINIKVPDEFNSADLPIIVANFAKERHPSEKPKHDFKAYYDILEKPPANDARPHPASSENCSGFRRLSVECGCCPPLGTDLEEVD